MRRAGYAALVGVGACLVLAAAGSAAAEKYAWPTSPAASNYRFDHDSGGGVKDHDCGPKSYNGHKGTDIAVGLNTAIRAAEDGQVIESVDGFPDLGDPYNQDGGGFGNHVALRHGDGEMTVYAHMSKGSVLPAVGNSASCGQQLGKVGLSGATSGAHLHFEVRKSDYAVVDPYSGTCSQPTSRWLNPSNPSSASCGDPPPSGDGALDARFIAHVTIAEGTQVGLGEPFTKTWRVENSGTSAWDDVSVVHVSGDSLNSGSTSVTAAPGDKVNVSVTMNPDKVGALQGVWKLSRNNSPFGDPLSVSVVGTDSGGPDADRDGSSDYSDCDDSNPDVRPGIAEVCDGLDNDCSGVADENLVRDCCGTGIQHCNGGQWGACDVYCADNGLTGGCSAGGRGGPSGLCTLVVPALILFRRRRKRAA